MWAKYAYNANITQANMLADIVAILTGTTDKATLSAGCDQANTEILATYDPAGWTVHDAAAGANAQVIKAECQGDAAQFKYVKISTNTAGQVYTGLWESWNAGTHVGTNLASGSETSGNGQRYATAATGVMYISASSGRILMYGVSSAGNGNANASGASGNLECGRGFTWCEVGAGFTPVIHWRGNYFTYCPRYKDSVGNVAAASGSAGSLTAFGGTMTTVMFPQLGPPSATGNHIPVTEMAISGSGTGIHFFSDLTPSGAKACGVGVAFDEFTYDGKTWVILPPNNDTTITKLCVPKG